ncbi:probable 2-oxoglutarate-dependent dioxygenase AOP1 [Durio zibethinus]|uniref:Probable 2-oxoglutarate-dependent dioxygenase AOP1 n=1 Tax=Durio zibethinus TaxID=66656 RepID=A0A6P5WEK9_DURZI|nr:probable 2-oxoglutarate-dependent dioxygenase AOP1 [Durio zibethinus]
MGEEICCETPLRLPIIDFSNKDLKQGTPEWDSVKVLVRKALEEFGCFEALVDEDIELREAVFGALEEVFDLPLETKMLNVSEKPYHGYLGVHPERSPLYESIGIDEPNITQNVEGLSNILWPQGNTAFSKSIQSLSEQVLGIERMVRRMILESLSLEKYMDEHMESNYYLLRLMKYKGPETTEAKLGLYGHTDKNTMTILYQNDVDGLEVRTKDGEWIHLKPSPASFIVMIGDILYAWLNGHVHSPFHRVMLKGNKTRYSAGLFSIPKAGYTIKAPEELVDEQHPLLFKPFTHDQFLGFLYTEAGQTAKCALSDYCGV